MPDLQSELSKVRVAQAPAPAPVASVSLQERVWRFLKNRPQGTVGSRVAVEFPGQWVSTCLHELERRGMITAEQVSSGRNSGRKFIKSYKAVGHVYELRPKKLQKTTVVTLPPAQPLPDVKKVKAPKPVAPKQQDSAQDAVAYVAALPAAQAKAAYSYLKGIFE